MLSAGGSDFRRTPHCSWRRVRMSARLHRSRRRRMQPARRASAERAVGGPASCQRHHWHKPADRSVAVLWPLCRLCTCCCIGCTRIRCDACTAHVAAGGACCRAAASTKHDLPRLQPRQCDWLGHSRDGHCAWSSLHLIDSCAAWWHVVHYSRQLRDGGCCACESVRIRVVS